MMQFKIKDARERTQLMIGPTQSFLSLMRPGGRKDDMDHSMSIWKDGGASTIENLVRNSFGVGLQ